MLITIYHTSYLMHRIHLQKRIIKVLEACMPKRKASL